jgi:hypothetical protein
MPPNDFKIFSEFDFRDFDIVKDVDYLAVVRVNFSMAVYKNHFIFRY